MSPESTERTSLLSTHPTASYETQQGPVSWPPAGGVKEESKVLWSLYWPLWTTQILDNLILIANVVVVGHIGVNASFLNSFASKQQPKADR